MNDKSKKIALVTGANSGLGKEIALGLVQAGVHVIMVCRHKGRGQAALESIKSNSGSESIDLLIADLSSQTDVRTLVNEVYRRYPRLDVLINNAGLVLTQKTQSVDGIEMTLATNYLGPFLLNHLLADLLKKSAPSRIINVSSAIQKWAKLDLNDLQYEHRQYQPFKAYAQSKLLLNIMTFELANRLLGTGVTVNCVHPGAVKTALGSNSNHSFWLKCMDKAIKLFFISPRKAANPVCYLAISPVIEKTTGNYFIKEKAALSNLISYDPNIVKLTWAISEKLCSFKA